MQILKTTLVQILKTTLLQILTTTLVQILRITLVQILKTTLVQILKTTLVQILKSQNSILVLNSKYTRTMNFENNLYRFWRVSTAILSPLGLTASEVKPSQSISFRRRSGPCPPVCVCVFVYVFACVCKVMGIKEKTV